jgi:MFS family permease
MESELRNVTLATSRGPLQRFMVSCGVVVGASIGAAIAGILTLYAGFEFIDGSSVDVCQSNEWCFGGPGLLAVMVILAVACGVAIYVFAKLFVFAEAQWNAPPTPPPPTGDPVAGPSNELPVPPSASS